MLKQELRDIQLIKLLEYALIDNDIEPWLKDIAKISIERLRTGTEEEKNNTRMAMRPFIEKYGLQQSKENPLMLEKINSCIKDITMRLKTLDVEETPNNDNSRSMLEFYLSKLQDSEISIEQKKQVILSYELRERCGQIILEIQDSLDQRDLVGNVPTELEALKNNLSDKEASDEFLHNMCLLWDNVYKPAIEYSPLRRCIQERKYKH